MQFSRNQVQWGYVLSARNRGTLFDPCYSLCLLTLMVSSETFRPWGIRHGKDLYDLKQISQISSDVDLVLNGIPFLTILSLTIQCSNVVQSRERWLNQHWRSLPQRAILSNQNRGLAVSRREPKSIWSMPHSSAWEWDQTSPLRSMGKKMINWAVLRIQKAMESILGCDYTVYPTRSTFNWNEL